MKKFVAVVSVVVALVLWTAAGGQTAVMDQIVQKCADNSQIYMTRNDAEKTIVYGIITPSGERQAPVVILHFSQDGNFVDGVVYGEKLSRDELIVKYPTPCSVLGGKR